MTETAPLTPAAASAGAPTAAAASAGAPTAAAASAGAPTAAAASAGAPTAAGPSAGALPTPGEGCEGLLSIGAAAAKAGVTERSLRYYQELGLLVPSALTKGGMRRYSQDDLDRVARIRELQSVIGLNLDEIADVLRSEDRIAQIKVEYADGGLPPDQRRRLLEEYLTLALGLRSIVEAKREAIDAFVTDLDARIGRIHVAIDALQEAPATAERRCSKSTSSAMSAKRESKKSSR